MSVSSGIIIHQTGRYLEVIYVGLTLLAIGSGLYITIGPASSLAKIVVFEAISGAGAGLLFQPPIIALQARVKQKDVATATGTLGFVRNIACSLSVVIGGVIFQNRMEGQSGHLRAAGVPSSLVQSFSGQDAEANVFLVGSIEDPAQRLVVKETFARSLRSVWIFYTTTAACGLLASVFIARTVLSKEHVETKTGLQREEKERGTATDGTQTSIEMQ